MEKTLKRYFLIFTLPTVIAFAFAFLIPFVQGVYLSFCKFTTVSNATWTGLANYKAAFSGGQGFMNALGFTASFTVVSVVTINLLAFTIALLLTRKIKGTNIFRTVFFMPNLIGGIVLGYIWMLILNGVLAKFGVSLTYDPRYGFWGLVILMNWQMIGYMMIIYVAGLTSISSDYVEAATIDGAKSSHILRYIILPLLMPSITQCLFLSMVNSLKVYDLNISLTNGNPFRLSEAVTMNVYQTAFSSNLMGYGSAKALLLVLVIAGVSLIQVAITSSKEVEL